MADDLRVLAQQEDGSSSEENVEQPQEIQEQPEVTYNELVTKVTDTNKTIISDKFQVLAPDDYEPTSQLDSVIDATADIITELELQPMDSFADVVENIVKLEQAIDNAGDIERRYLRNFALDILKEQTIPGYGYIENIEQMYEVFEMARGIYEFISENEQVLELPRYTADLNFSDFERSKIKNIIESIVYPDWYKEGTSIMSEQHPYNLSPLKGAIEVIKPLLPGVHSVLEDAAQIRNNVDIVLDILQDLSRVNYVDIARSEYNRIVDEFNLETMMHDIIGLVSIMEKEGIYSAELNPELAVELLFSNVLAAAKMYLPKDKVASYASRYFDRSIAKQFIDTAWYFVPFVGPGLVVKDVYNLMTKESALDQAKDTNIDLLVPKILQLPATLDIESTEGVRVLYNPVLGKNILFYSTEFDKKGKLVPVDVDDITLISKVLGLIPTNTRFGGILKLINSALRVTLPITAPYASVLTDADYGRILFADRTISVEADVNAVASSTVLVQQVIQNEQTKSEIRQIYSILTDEGELFNEKIRRIIPIVTSIVPVLIQNSEDHYIGEYAEALNNIIGKAKVKITNKPEDQGMVDLISKAENLLTPLLATEVESSPPQTDDPARESSEVEDFYQEGSDSKWKGYF